MKHWLSLKREKALVWFWHKIPDSWLYWAVITAWARVTTKEYQYLTPNEVTWEMTCKALRKRSRG